jgi:hypothetical protein
LGNALTVYGRNGTKLATAFNHGAAAVLLVPSTPPFRYVWENNARENMTLRDGNERQQVKAQALISIDKAATIFAATGNDLERARTAAAAPGFRAVALSARVTITVINQVRRFESQNILAKIEGSDPALKNEYVIYSGHCRSMPERENHRDVRDDKAVLEHSRVHVRAGCRRHEDSPGDHSRHTGSARRPVS